MPTYEYECLGCGQTFERFQSITDKPIRRCPHCRRGKVRRLIGAGAGILFRGSGFYQTDYRSEEYKAKAKADKGPAGGDGKKDSAAKGSCAKEATAKDGAKGAK